MIGTWLAFKFSRIPKLSLRDPCRRQSLLCLATLRGVSPSLLFTTSPAYNFPFQSKSLRSSCMYIHRLFYSSSFPFGHGWDRKRRGVFYHQRIFNTSTQIARYEWPEERVRMNENSPDHDTPKTQWEAKC